MTFHLLASEAIDTAVMVRLKIQHDIFINGMHR